jgi:hypothetical protein
MTLIRRRLPTSVPLAALAIFAVASFAAATFARADEDDDIQRQIEIQKAGVSDLEHLDRGHSAAVEIQRLRDWLNAAWDLRNKHEPDDAREVLERCMAQAELVRQVIASAQVKAQVTEKESKLTNTRAEIERKKHALQEAQIKKRTLAPAVSK